MMDLAFDLKIAGVFSVFIPIVIGVIYFKKIDNRLRILISFLSFSFLFDAKQWFEIFTPYRAAFYISFGLIQFQFYWFFLNKYFSIHSFYKFKNIIALGMLATWFSCYLPFMLGDFSFKIQSIYDVGQAVILSVYSAVFILEMSKQEAPVFHDEKFWFVFGVFFYFFMNIFMYMFMHAGFRDEIWSLHSIFDITKHTLFALAIALHVKHFDKKIL